MTNAPHSSDMLDSIPDVQAFRAQLIPGWAKAVACIILLFSLVILYSLFEIATTSIEFEGITELTCFAIGLVSGISAAGLMLERRWALQLAIWSMVFVLCVFCGFLVYDLFFYRRILWLYVFLECFTITTGALYLRTLWKIRHTWKEALPEPAPARRIFK